MANFILLLPILLLSVVAHEFAHAWVAYRQGDPTAYMLGRLTLNPLKHLDPFMSVLFPAVLWWLTKGTFTFGAARPVPVNARNFRHPRRGDLLTSSAGVAMNLVLAVGCGLGFVAAGMLATAAPATHDFLQVFQQMVGMGVSLNLLLTFFNLLPVPPLDGSHLFYYLLPARWGAKYREWSRYGVVLLLVLLMVPALWQGALAPVGWANQQALDFMEGWAIP